MRLVRGSADELADSFRTGLREARADVIVAVAPGGRPRPGLSLWLANSFANDALAVTVEDSEATTLTAASASENVEGTLDRLIRQTRPRKGTRPWPTRDISMNGSIPTSLSTEREVAQPGVAHRHPRSPGLRTRPAQTLTQAVRNEAIARLIIGLRRRATTKNPLLSITDEDTTLRFGYPDPSWLQPATPWTGQKLTKSMTIPAKRRPVWRTPAAVPTGLRLRAAQRRAIAGPWEPLPVSARRDGA